MFLAAVRINNTDVVQMRKNDRNEKYKYKNKHKLAPNKKKKIKGALDVFGSV